MHNETKTYSSLQVGANEIRKLGEEKTKKITYLLSLSPSVLKGFTIAMFLFTSFPNTLLVQ